MPANPSGGGTRFLLCSLVRHPLIFSPKKKSIQSPGSSSLHGNRTLLRPSQNKRKHFVLSQGRNWTPHIHAILPICIVGWTKKSVQLYTILPRNCAITLVQSDMENYKDITFSLSVKGKNISFRFKLEQHFSYNLLPVSCIKKEKEI